MNMLPINPHADAQYVSAIFPSKTYAVDIENGHIRGYADGLAAMKQAVYMALNTERFQYLAYSDNYGIELLKLIGTPISYCLPEIKRYIAEALTWDSRIERVDNFEFDVRMGAVHCTFTVHTIYGNVDAGKVVNI